MEHSNYNKTQVKTVVLTVFSLFEASPHTQYDVHSRKASHVTPPALHTQHTLEPMFPNESLTPTSHRIKKNSPKFEVTAIKLL